MVDTWRLAARAAALGEHDFGAGVGYGRLSEDHCMTVRKDAAEVGQEPEPGRTCWHGTPWTPIEVSSGGP